MVIRKPYAFLIKHFKLIHIGIFLIFGFLILSLRELYGFFKTAVDNSSMYNGVEQVNRYTSIFLILAIILLLVLSFAIYFLLRKKEKPVLFYELIFGYGIVLFVVYFIYRSYFTKSSMGVEYAITSLVFYRDSSLILYLLTYGFVGYSFVRAFGFDIKKFSFDKDKKELNISSSDNEEIELNINLDKDKIVNSIRKEKRQVKYFIEDNKVVLKKILIVIVVALGLYLLYNILITRKTYRVGQDIMIPSMGSIINVEKVILTDRDAYNNLASSKYKYVGVKVQIRTTNKTSLKSQLLRMKINGEYYYPTRVNNSVLSDYGSLCSFEQTLYPNSEYDCLLLYEYSNSINARSVSMEVLLDNGYHKVRTNYIEQNNLKEGYTNKEFDYNKEIPVFDGFTIIDSTIHGATVTYQYDDPACKEKDCKKLTKRVQPNLNDKILELKVNYKANKTNNRLLDYYLSIDYEINGKRYTDSAKNIKLLDYANLEDGQRLYLSINSKIASADKKYLVLTTREAKYELELQKEN